MTRLRTLRGLSSLASVRPPCSGRLPLVSDNGPGNMSRTSRFPPFCLARYQVGQVGDGDTKPNFPSAGGDSQQKPQTRPTPRPGSEPAGPGRGLEPAGPSPGLDSKTLRHIALLTGSQFLVNAGFGVVIPVLPQMASSLGLGAAGVGLIVSAPAICRLVVNVPLGHLADTKGRVPLMVGGMLVNGLAQLGTGLSTSVAGVIASRLLVGLGSGASMAGAQAMMADITERAPQHRAKVMAVQSAIVTVAFVIGPAFGGWVAETHGFETAFYIVALLCGVTTVGYSFLPETLSKRPSSDGTDKEKWSWASSLREWGKLLRNRDQQAVFVMHSALFTGYAAIMTIIPLHALANWEAGPGDIGSMLAGISALGFIGAPFGGWMADWLGHKFVIIPFTSLIFLGCAGTALSSTYTEFLVCMSLWGFGNSVVVPALTAFTAAVAPPHKRGRALGLARQAGDMAFLVGPIGLGAIAQIFEPKVALIATSVIISCASVVFTSRALRRREAWQLFTTTMRSRKKKPPS